MTKNIGSIDRFFRAIIGLGILYMPSIVHEPWAIWVGLIGIIPLASAIAGYCPMYKLSGCSSCYCKACGCKDCSCKDKSCGDEVKKE